MKNLNINFVITILFFTLISSAQEVIEDKNEIKESLTISTQSIENSGLTQDQIIDLDEQTRILACRISINF